MMSPEEYDRDLAKRIKETGRQLQGLTEEAEKRGMKVQMNVNNFREIKVSKLVAL